MKKYEQIIQVFFLSDKIYNKKEVEGGGQMHKISMG